MLRVSPLSLHRLPYHVRRTSTRRTNMAEHRILDENLHKLFPVPSPAPSPQAPARFPGITPETTKALQKTLRDNHVKWHIFFNLKRFHKWGSSCMISERH